MATRVAITMLVPDPGAVVTEYLRYAGVVSVYSIMHTGRPPMAVEGRFADRGMVLKGTHILLTMYIQVGLETQAFWVTQQIDRLKSFHVAAVAWKETHSSITILGDTRAEISS